MEVAAGRVLEGWEMQTDLLLKLQCCSFYSSAEVQDTNAATGV